MDLEVHFDDRPEGFFGEQADAPKVRGDMEKLAAVKESRKSFQAEEQEAAKKATTFYVVAVFPDEE